ncbi:exopolyphosphatase [Aestuariibacter halophilus]|uniref:Exopolyphosphatase n=1 Tax=Fluctibacter halophilus TaxID=226011 RepID=A0ABS8GCS6_9ALTE|nr:exopolyphosphatase [Aestuariibacter halophilus]MCC2618056.1 exopolyphosphatase [Aestuariibacter halophilus]
MATFTTAFDNVETREVSNVAALDIGSNSFHLVVARIVAGSVQILHRVKQRVSLADGLNEQGMLSEEAMQRGWQTLRVIAESLQGFEPDTVRIVATYTLRKAKNAKAFIRGAKDILPYPIEIIPGSEEARLIYSGVAHTNYDEGQRLVMDIGGGSTEFIIGKGFDTKVLSSLQMGCVSYTRRFFADGQCQRKHFKKAITAAQQELESIDKRFPRVGWQHVIGTSGTIKIATQLALHFEPWLAPDTLSRSALDALVKAVQKAGHCDALQLEGLTEERRPVLAAGLAILTAAFESLNLDMLQYSPAALREGVLYEMEDRLQHHDIRERTAESLATRYDVDTAHAKRVLSSAQLLLTAANQGWGLNHPDCMPMLGWAALLHEVGLHINSRGVQRHSAYILQNLELPGFNQEQQTLLALLARFHRKKVRLEDIPDFSEYDSAMVVRLIALLRLAVLMNQKRQDDWLPPMEIRAHKRTLYLTFPTGWLKNKPILAADLSYEKQYWLAMDLRLVVK